MLNYKTFYKELGNLFYAIAAIDDKIRPEEKDRLHDEIRFGWKHFEDSKDRFGTDNAYLIEFEFDTMEESFETAASAFSSFESYFRDNEKDIDTHTRQRIFNSARHIAETIRKINSSELEYLMRLKKILEI